MDLPQLGPVAVLLLKSRKSPACPELPPPPPPSQKPPPLPYTATENALIKFKFCFSFTQTGQICNLAAFRTM